MDVTARWKSASQLPLLNLFEFFACSRHSESEFFSAACFCIQGKIEAITLFLVGSVPSRPHPWLKIAAEMCVLILLFCL